MRTFLECVSCFINQAIRAFRANNVDEERIEGWIPEILRILERVDFRKTPMENASLIYGVIKELLGVQDVYAEVKRMHNEIFLDNYQRFKKIVEESDDRLRTAMELSCSANIIDLGSRDVSIEGVFEEVVSRIDSSFYVDHYKSFRNDLSRAETLVFFLDNAGEAVLDMLLVETISKEFPRISKIWVVAKAEPFINDITVDEALDLGFERIPDVEVLGVYPDPFKDPNYRSKELVDLLLKADVVIAKGQANFEALEFPGVYHLFYVKCSPILRCVNAPIGSPVLFKRA